MLTRTSLLILYALLSYFGFSQNIDRDAQELVWKSKMHASMERVKAGRLLVKSYVREDNARALEIAKEVAQFGSNGGSREVQLISLLTLGTGYESVSEHREAITAYENALGLYNNSFTVQHKVDALLGLGRSWSDRGDQTNASTYFRDAVKLVETKNDEALKAEVYVAIAEFYRRTVKYDYALNYLKKVRTLVAKGSASPAVEMEMYSRFAAVLNEQNKNKDSIPYYSKKCIELGRKYGDEHVVATAMNELGFYYSETKPELSLSYYEGAIAIWKELNFVRYEAHCLFNLIRAHDSRFQYSELVGMLEEISDRMEGKPWLLQRFQAHQFLASYYELGGFDKKALEHYKKYLELHAQYSLLTNQRQLDEIQEKYETERNLRTISEQNDLIKKERKEKEESDSRAQRFLLFSLLLGVILTGVIYAIYRVRKSNQMLRKQKVLIEASKIQLQELLEGRELLLKEIHHRVKNNLQMVVSLLELQAMGVKDPETKAVLQTGNQRVKSMALVHKRLYQGDDLGYVEVDAYLQSLMLEIDAAFTDKNQRVARVLQGNGISLDVDTIIPLGLILTELITNSFKYAQSNPLEIRITISEMVRGTFELVYQDNGVGIPDGFELKKAKSLGMRMIKRLTQQLNGSLEFENRGGVYVKISFEGTKQRQKTA